MGWIVRNYKNILSKFNTRSLMSICSANIEILDIKVIKNLVNLWS